MLRKVFASPVARKSSTSTLFAALREKLKQWCQRLAEGTEQFFAGSKVPLRRPSARLSLEGLEDRVVPSTANGNPPAERLTMVSTSTAQVQAAEAFLQTAWQTETQALATLSHDLQNFESEWLVFAASSNPLIAAWGHNNDSLSTTPQTSGIGSSSGSMSTAHEANYAPSTDPSASKQGGSMGTANALEDVYNPGVRNVG